MWQQAVKAIREDLDVSSAAADYGINMCGVFRWLADFDNGGQNTLLTKPIPRRSPKVIKEEMLWLAKFVREDTPLQYKFAFGLRTLSLIASLIERKFSETLSLASVSHIMKLLDFSAQKPLYQAIRAEAKAKGAKIYFASESRIRSAYHAGTTRAPIGDTSAAEVNERCYSLNIISAVSPRGNFRFMLHDSSVNALEFKKFLKRLLPGADGPVFLVVDGYPIHKVNLLKEFVAAQGGILKLLYLPQYSPQLNRDEPVWGYVKRQISRQLVQSKDEMKRISIGALRPIQKLPELVKTFFANWSVNMSMSDSSYE